LKSLLASIALAWCLGHNPSAQILCVSYAQDLADKLARDCRSIMMSPWYRQIFPTRLAPHRQAVQEFLTTRQGYRLAASNGGVLTGRGADIILIDDPLKPEEALSDKQRQAANDWFDHTLYSRLNDKRNGAIVIIMQRLHEDDLIGHVLAQEAWEVVRFPAIAEEDDQHEAETIWGKRCFQRQRGEALHPTREPLATLEQIRTTIGEYNFAGQWHRQFVQLRSRRYARLGLGAPRLCQSGHAGDLGPSLKGLGASGAMLIGGDVVAAEMEEVIDLVVGGEEALGLAGHSGIFRIFGAGAVRESRLMRI
jgi:hypothetical protein